jgi:hypothetical protein
MLDPQMFGIDDGPDFIDRFIQLEIAVNDHIVEIFDPLKFLARGGDPQRK